MSTSADASLTVTEMPVVKIILNCILSFLKWPSDVVSVSPILLANAGFEYTGPGDRVTCPVCRVQVEGFRSKRLKNPKDEHKDRSPECSLILACCSDSAQQLVANVRLASEAIPPSSVTASTGAPIARATQTSNTVEPPATDCTDVILPNVNSAPSQSLPVNPRNVPRTAASASASASATPCFSGYVEESTTRASGELNLMSSRDRKNPDNRRMNNESHRLMTFAGWPSIAAVQPSDLAADGWYYTGQNDRVLCAFCKGSLHRWTKGDTPATEHQKHYPECRFVKGLDVGNVPLASKTHTSPAKATVTAGKTDAARCRSATERWVSDNAARDEVARERTSGCSSNSSRLGDVYRGIDNSHDSSRKDYIDDDTPNGIESIRSADQRNTRSRDAPSCRDAAVDTTAETSEWTLDEEVKQLLDENQTLIQSRTCKVCMDKMINTVFLPCGHFVTCQDCASKLRDCPVCRTYVRGTVKSSFSWGDS